MLLGWGATVEPTSPVVSNVSAEQRLGTKLVDITYDATGGSGPLRVSVVVSTNAGTTYDLPAIHFSGNGYGSGVTAGMGKSIVWDAGADWPNRFSANVRFRVSASDSTEPIVALSGDLSFGAVTARQTARRRLRISNATYGLLASLSVIGYSSGFRGKEGLYRS